MQLFTFWEGGALTDIETLCLTSMVAVGHRVDLYSFGDRMKVPDGVRLRDARKILPAAKLIFHRKTGSPALFANIFRYEALRKRAGTWVDTDLLVIKSLSQMGDFVLGWEDARTMNNAVLLMPSQSPCLEELCAFATSEVIVAPFWSIRKQTVQRIKSLVGAQRKLEDLEWGVIGPKALTHFVKAHKLIHRVQPSDVFYPVHWRDVSRLWADDGDVEKLFTSSTRAVHLWNKGLKRHAVSPAPENCFLAQMARKLGLKLFGAT